MEAIVDLFSTDDGRMSLGVIAFVVLMAVGFHRIFTRTVEASERVVWRP